MDAKNAFKKLQYRSGYWVHDYLRALLQYKEDMAHVGVEITDEELMSKFKEEVINKAKFYDVSSFIDILVAKFFEGIVVKYDF